MEGSGSGEGEVIPIAVIGRPRGNRGEVILHPYFDLSSESLDGKEVALCFPDGSVVKQRVRRVWWHREKTICGLEGCESIDEARELVHAEVLIARSELEPLEEGEYFASDLVGCRVFLKDGTAVGTVVAAEDRGAPLLTLRGAEGQELLIPFAAEIVLETDIEGGRIVIDPPQGLLEINED